MSKGGHDDVFHLFHLLSLIKSTFFLRIISGGNVKTPIIVVISMLEFQACQDQNMSNITVSLKHKFPKIFYYYFDQKTYVRNAQD